MSRNSHARHVAPVPFAVVPRGKGILERLFGFTPKRQHRRATFVGVRAA